jgi:hypothetical protein
MHIQIKQFNWAEGNYMIIIAQGILNVRSLEQILIKVAAASLARAHCKVLIDFVDASCTIVPTQIDRLFSRRWPGLYPSPSKIALVSPSDDNHHASVSDVSTCLGKHGLRVAVFRDSKAAVDWLADLV